MLGIVAQAITYLNRWTRAQNCDPDPTDPDPDPRIAYLAPDLGVPMTVDVVRANVHASMGSFEDLEHSLHFRAKSGYSGPNDETALRLFASRLGAAWAAWWADTTDVNGSGTVATSALFHPQLSYDYIDVSYLEYGGLGAAPATLTPTTRWNFATPLAGTATNTAALPFEVACCLTLLTDTAGKRTRGRVYLGGLTATWMVGGSSPSTSGFFEPAAAKGVAGRFGAKVIDGIHVDAAANYELNIVSRMSGAARGVGGVRVGMVPDSQRRRRWHQPENPFLAWGTA